MNIFERLCAMCYHLYNFKNVKKTHGGLLLLLKFIEIFLKYGVFLIPLLSKFLNKKSKIFPFLYVMIYAISYHLYNFKKREKQPMDKSYFTKSDTPPRAFFMFLTLYKWC